MLKILILSSNHGLCGSNKLSYKRCAKSMGNRPVKSHSGTRGNILDGPQTFSRGPSGKEIFEFFFLKWYTLAYFIFLADGLAPQTSRGLGVADLSTPPS